MQKVYIAIDLKSFYASVECVAQGLDPLTARLVVADISRTDKTICLAVSPALKELGLGGRERLYKVIRVARRAGVDFTVAPPRMQKYMDISRQIYGIYTKFVAPADIHVYSVDEVFIDATPYLNTYKMSGRELAEKMIHVVLKETGITATAGVGSNMYLAKIAMDIEAKHLPADKHGVRIAELNEISYRQKLWEHQPLTDFWRIGPGIQKRLHNLGIKTMGDLAYYSLTGSDKLYATFGVNAELIIDHAWGWEPVTMQDVKNYESANHSLSSGQILHEPYDFDSARLILWEMADAMALELFEKKLVTNQLSLMVGYDKSATNYHGETYIDRYGRKAPKPAHGSVKLEKYSNSAKLITEKLLKLYDEVCLKNVKVRRIMISMDHLIQSKNDEKPSSMIYQTNLFTDYDDLLEKEEKEERLQEAVVAIKKRYGKNALMKLKNYEDGATMRMRNKQIGGHRA